MVYTSPTCLCEINFNGLPKFYVVFQQYGLLLSFNVLTCLCISGAFMTAGVLTAGLISFRQGNSHLGQKLMRARVVVQGATVALMVGTAYYYGENF